MPPDDKSKTILITGCSSGIGLCVADGLKDRGYRVFATARNPDDVEALAKEGHEALQLDLDYQDSIQQAVQEVLSRTDNQLYALFNNGAYGQPGAVEDLSRDTLRQQFETNVFGTLALTQGFARQMVKRGSGKIVMVTSMGGLITVPFAAVYTATKHALEGLTEGLKAELAGTGVEICTANPGVFGTGFNDRGAETMMRWFNPETTFSRPELLAAMAGGLDNQLDPQLMIDALVRIVEEDGSKFRNVVPEAIVPWIQAMQTKAWKAGKDDSLWIDPATL